MFRVAVDASVGIDFRFLLDRDPDFSVFGLREGVRRRGHRRREAETSDQETLRDALPSN